MKNIETTALARVMCRWFVPALLLVVVWSPSFASKICSETSLDGETTIEVQIDTPEPGTQLRAFSPDCANRQLVEGFASTVGLPPDFDVYIAIDRSGSTGACSGVDVDEDGIVGTTGFDSFGRIFCSDEDDSILEAELEAARRFVDTLSPESSRVAIIDFSAECPQSPAGCGVVQVRQALTHDFDEVQCALDRMSAVALDCDGLRCGPTGRGDCGPRGATDYGAALTEIVDEHDLNGSPDRNQVALFLSDGHPTAPVQPFDQTNGGDIQAALDGAHLAAARGIVVNTFAVGKDADSSTLRQIADITGGDHFDIETPGEIVDVLPGTSLVGVERIVIRNLTTGFEREVEISPEGKFSLNVPVVAGLNEIEVEAVADDEDGTTVFCHTNVEVVCITFACPDDRDEECSEPGGAYVDGLTATASDDEVAIANNSPHDSSPEIGDETADGLYPLGSTDFEFHFDDVEAGSRSCLVMVSVEDTTAPELSCSASSTAAADEDCRAIVEVSAEASDLCTDPSELEIRSDAPEDDTYELGSTTVTFEVTDGAGHETSCDTTVTVEDRTPPEIECPESRVEEVGELGCEADLDLEASASDNCEDQTGLTVEDDAPDSFPIGATTVTYTATDGAGASASCETLVEVVDAFGPEIDCPEDTLLETGPDDVDCMVPHDPEATAEDLCDPDVSVTDDAPDEFSLGDTTVTHRAEDSSENEASCSHVVTLVDTTDPAIDCTEDVTLETEPDDVDCAVAYDASASASDNCDGDLSVSDDAPEVYPAGTTTVTFRTEDAAGNAAECSQDVTVLDRTPPQLDCPEAMELRTGPDDEDCLVPYQPVANATDNCDQDIAVTNDAPEFFPVGDTKVTFTATDEAGNSASCSQIVTVIDDTPPSIDCPGDETILTGEGDEDCKVPFDTDVTARDNCSGDVEVTSNALSEYGLGEHEVIYEAVDAAGNTTTCSQMVIVLDNTPPVLDCPQDVLLETGPDDDDCMVPYDPTAEARDNCDPDLEIVDDSPGLFPLGATTVTFRTQDDSGNTAQCSTVVTVIDTTPPEIAFPEGQDSCLWPPNHRFYCFDTDDQIVATDNCDADLEISLACLPNPPGNSASNQPVDSTGDGAFAPDCVVALDEASGYCVRSERKGDARDHQARVYEIGVVVQDDSGNQATDSLEVRVDHDRKGKQECRDAKPSSSYGPEDKYLPAEYPQFRLPSSPGQRKQGK